MKKVINIIVLMFLVILFICNSVYAATIPVTDENLIESFQKFVKSGANEENYKISVSNNLITVSVDNENYIMKYDLTDKPTFSLEVPIEKGMSYDDFEKQTGNLILPMLGYIAVADIQGIKMEDASAYFLFSYLGSALNGSVSSENSYIIVDDLNGSEGVKIENTDDSKIIYASEFGDRIIEYIDNIYKEKQNISDESGINSFSSSIEKQDITETSRKLITTLSVNIDADFSKINGYVEGLKGSSDKDKAEENTQKDSETKVDNELNIDTLPKTGEETNIFLIVLYIIVATCSIALIALLLKRKRK